MAPLMICASSERLRLSATKHEAGGAMGKIMAIVSFLPAFITALALAPGQFRRGWQRIAFLSGILANVLFNSLLKHIIRQPRPRNTCYMGDDDEVENPEEFGMPCHHAQFMSFVATFATLCLRTPGGTPSVESQMISLAGWAASALCSYSQVYLKYHSTWQVFVGTLVGAISACFWFEFYICKLEPLRQRLMGSSSLCEHLPAREAVPVGDALETDEEHLHQSKSLGEKPAGCFRAKVVTYNIAGRHAGFSVQKIVDVLRSVEADVVCLQEVNGSSLERTDAHAIAAALRMSCTFAQGPEDIVFGNAILSRWPLGSTEIIELPCGSATKADGSRMPGSRERRVALTAVVCPPCDVTCRDFIIICTHFGIYNEFDLASPESLEPVRRIHSFLKLHRSTPALLAGDLNAQPGSSVLKELDKNWNIHKQYDEVVTCGNIKIDYILDRGRGVWKMGLQYALSMEETQHASDHCPLVAEWEAICE
eukprot:TRINITY_DN42161_c0_g1_i1.p1 TRINITY_DN42161_c0_g1~~TRINITY_DN42161_c0_g1_i1.p1  ORF type:complete len:480 (-),score=54.47 TRINITY_DN42161_c0_g1_i1:16-1455(-)